MTQEIVSFGIGQCGIQIQSRFWESILNEYGVKNDGTIELNNTTPGGLHHYFKENSEGYYTPRAVFIDTEPGVIDCIRNGHLKSLFAKRAYISGKESAGNCYARGRNHAGLKILDDAVNACRQELENCSKVRSTLNTRATGGGTGSGTGNLLFNTLYGLNFIQRKQATVTLCLTPSRALSSSCTGPINNLLALPEIHDLSDLIISIDNEALYRKCILSGDQSPNFANVNDIIATLMTVQFGFYRTNYSEASRSAANESACTINDLAELQTNLVPFPRCNYVCSTLSRIGVKSAPYGSGVYVNNKSLGSTQDCFDTRHSLSSVNINKGYFFSMSLYYRTKIANLNHMNEAIKYARDYLKVKFVDWCPTGIKLSYGEKPYYFPKTSKFRANKMLCCALLNHSSIQDLFETNALTCQGLIDRQAYIYWYINGGMDPKEISESLEFLKSVVADYKFLTSKNNVPEDKNKKVSKKIIPHEPTKNKKMNIKEIKMAISKKK